MKEIDKLIGDIEANEKLKQKAKRKSTAIKNKNGRKP